MRQEKVIVLALLLALTVASFANHRRRAAQVAFRSFEAHFALKEYSKAESYANAALGGDPENAYYLAAKALVTARMVETKSCTKPCLDGALNLNDEGSQHIRESIELYGRAIALNPRDGSFHHNLGRLYGFLDQKHLAIEAMETAAAINPDIPLYHVSLGIYLEVVGRELDAFKEFLIAIELSPSLIDSEAFSDFQRRHGSEAKEIIVQVIEKLERQARGDDPIVQSKLSKLYMYVGRKEEAHQKLLKITTELPTLSKPWIYLGDYYGETQEWRQMLLCYQRAGFLNADDFVPWLRLGDYFYESGQGAQATDAYKRALFTWMNQSSIQAERAGRIYRTLEVVRDDVIPNGLLAYCAPRFDSLDITARLAKLSSDNRDLQSAAYFAGLRSGISRLGN